eukprot:GEMP01040789.1.p1 GENE.GEMP01040789.1~~GEMP01040789.1.p1  ORF type:complete len:356 (+),score=53.40 GEMP01040789.1:18-1085(+)
MIDSLFILTGGGSFVVEKHLKGKHSREVLDAFFSSLKDHEPADVPKAIRASSSTALLHIYRNDLFYLAVVSAEVCPLAVFDLLSRFYGVLQRYIGTPTDDSLRAHFSTSYLLMDEMMDSGFPFTTDLNQLEAIIAPPTTLNKVVSVVAGGSTQAIRNENELDPVSRLVSAVSGQPHTPTSSTPSQGIWWRRSNVTYASNEVYADVIERIDCILDSTGNVAMGGIAGEIQVNAKLSGASPECRLTIRNAGAVWRSSRTNSSQARFLPNKCSPACAQYSEARLFPPVRPRQKIPRAKCAVVYSPGWHLHSVRILAPRYYAEFSRHHSGWPDVSRGHGKAETIYSAPIERFHQESCLC